MVRLRLVKYSLWKKSSQISIIDLDKGKRPVQ